MSIKERFLLWLGFDVVIEIEPHFEECRIIRRRNKEILQKLSESNYAEDSKWRDVKTTRVFK